MTATSRLISDENWLNIQLTDGHLTVSNITAANHLTLQEVSQTEVHKLMSRLVKVIVVIHPLLNHTFNSSLQCNGNLFLGLRISFALTSTPNHNSVHTARRLLINP